MRVAWVRVFAEGAARAPFRGTRKENSTNLYLDILVLSDTLQITKVLRILA